MITSAVVHIQKRVTRQVDRDLVIIPTSSFGIFTGGIEASVMGQVKFNYEQTERGQRI